MALRYVLGLDLGPPAEPTGLAVVERVPAEEGGAGYAVRHLVRFPPGTPFAAVAAAVADTIRDGRLGRPPVVCDLTAVGPTLLPVLRRAGLGYIVPVVLTAGMDASEVERTWRVPKRDLVNGLQLLLQQRRLKVADGLPEAELLLRELAAFRPVPLGPADAADWRTRPGDDLVLAVALAAWWAGRNAGSGTITSGGGEELHALLDHLFPDLVLHR